ncbi:MAG: HAMP domain-containing protein, partial [Hamadaea sp.]|nr:HAMP domain-containing protein [Hamadaea sp.]
MSFRLRVVLLIVFLVTTSSAATAWLTLRQAERQLTDSVQASQRDVTSAVRTLSDYGRTRGTWEGVEKPVAQLAAELGQRVRLETAAGAVLADSDLLGGHEARPVAGVPSIVDALPPLTFPASAAVDHKLTWTIAVVDNFRRGWVAAECLDRAGVGMHIQQYPGKPPFLVADDGPEPVIAQCNALAKELPQYRESADVFSKPCLTAADPHVCLQKFMADALAGTAPETAQLYLGARDEVVTPQISSTSIALAAAAVILAAILAAVLLSRRVLRPIGALTTASRRLGSGDRGERVPVSGRDELTDLARAFNRMAESLAASEDRQRRLIADVAHELRTPLANLRGYLEGLADGVLRPSPELFASLHEEALLQQRIVDDLQDLAMAEAGVLAYHKGIVDVAELAETCRTAHAAVAEAAGLRLDVSVAAAARVHADPDRLRQVIGNLMRNGIAATPPGGRVTLVVGVDGHQAFLAVSDTGRGIAAADLPHVFDRLWRADPARRRA